MIKLKQILFESVLGSYWVEPDGEEHSLKRESHLDWANDYIEENDMTKLKNGFLNDGFNILLNQGWLRVGSSFTGNVIGFQWEGNLNYNLIDNFIMNHLDEIKNHNLRFDNNSDIHKEIKWQDYVDSEFNIRKALKL